MQLIPFLKNKFSFELRKSFGSLAIILRAINCGALTRSNANLFSKNGLRVFLKFSLYVSLIFLLAGCQLLTPYKGPIAPTPNQWKTNYDAPDAGKSTIPSGWKENPSNKHSQNDAIASETVCSEDVTQNLCHWWEIFNDPVLNQLEQQALNSSYNLWAALERVIQARLQARINFSSLLPQLNFTPSFSRTGSLFQNPFSDLGCFLGNDSAKQGAYPTKTTQETPSLLSNTLNDFRFIQTQYLVPLNLNYELDLWYQLHNAYYASIIQAQAASQAYLSVLLSLTADIATAYFQIRGLDAQQEVIQRNIRVRQEAVDVNRARYNAGLIVYLDVSRAEVELARAHSDSDDIQRLRGLQENLLATLVGIPASVFSVNYDPVIVPPPVIPRGLPSELLCRRPDIAEAERNLAAVYREIGVAYANFFPSLNLNATFGFQTPLPHQLLSWRSRLWEVGWNLVQTVFDAGRNAANLDYYKSLFRESMAHYQQTVLKSFQDVEDALVNLRGYADQAMDLAIAVRAARVSLELAQMRYNRGLTNYLDVVDAERQLLETEQKSTIVLGNRYVSTVLLIRALGGGWGPCEKR